MATVLPDLDAPAVAAKQAEIEAALMPVISGASVRIAMRALTQVYAALLLANTKAGQELNTVDAVMGSMRVQAATFAAARRMKLMDQPIGGQA